MLITVHPERHTTCSNSTFDDQTGNPKQIEPKHKRVFQGEFSSTTSEVAQPYDYDSDATADSKVKLTIWLYYLPKSPS